MTRKLKSREYCHNCGKESDWEFVDKAINQIIRCPLCDHKHYRVVTGQLVRPEIRWNGKLVENVKKFLKEHPELKKDFQKLEEEAEMKFEVSGDRWDTDPAQAQPAQVAGGSISYSFADTSDFCVTNYNSSGNYTPDGNCYDSVTACDSIDFPSA